MNLALRNLVIAPALGMMLSGCELVTDFFLTESTEDASSCEYVLSEFGEPGLLCAECNSSGEDQASAEACGTEISVRCNSDLGDPIFGIAVGGSEAEATLYTATAWVDFDDTEGPSEGDELFCHMQAVGGFGKQEWKCTNALKGNGKTATTFEAEIKYDESKDDCSV